MWMRITVLVTASCGFTPTLGSDAPPTGDDAPGSHDDAKLWLDAPLAFDPTQCPPLYTSIGGTGTNTRYRVPPANVYIAFTAAEAACEADRGNGPATHLVVFDTPMEHAAVIGAAYLPLNYNFMWTGNYTVHGGTWTKITAGPMSDPDWVSPEPVYKTNGTPPNNPNGAMLRNLNSATHGDYQAQPFNFGYNFICECDGLPATLP